MRIQSSRSLVLTFFLALASNQVIAAEVCDAEREAAVNKKKSLLQVLAKPLSKVEPSMSTLPAVANVTANETKDAANTTAEKGANTTAKDAANTSVVGSGSEDNTKVANATGSIANSTPTEGADGEPTDGAEENQPIEAAENETDEGNGTTSENATAAEGKSGAPAVTKLSVLSVLVLFLSVCK